MKRFFAFLLTTLLILSMIGGTAFAAKAKVKTAKISLFTNTEGTISVPEKVGKVDMTTLTWSSSNSAIASYSNGEIKGNAAGKTVITASAAGLSLQCNVTVLPTAISVDKGSTYTLPNAGIESYAVQNKAIATVSKRGVITGKSEGTTTIRVKYKKQTVDVDVTVTDNTDPKDGVSELECAAETNQIILVEYQSGSKAKLSIHEKKKGIWKELYSCSAVVGKNGIDKTREGDKKTPTGTYNLTTPFGIKADPGSKMRYTQVTKYHYWCGTSGTEYYNRMIDTRVTERAPASTDEYLIKYKGSYDYAMFIDYNADGEAGKGSCIFLHCKTGSSTAGCIAVDKSVMKKIIQWAEPGCKIVIR